MKKLLMLILSTLFISSCANKVTPTGGEKDIKPPVVKESEPVNPAIDFHGREIKLKFEEYVQLTDLNGQLLISPLMPSTPEIKALKKEILIKLPDSLRENTTYTINFGKSIADIHESNAIENYKFIFSTGPIIDSLFIQGTVRNAKNNETLKGISVMMYRKEGVENPDSLVFVKRPDYFSKTDDKGAYNISNVAGGEYYVFAFEDKNNDYKCGEDEMLGFVDRIVKLPGESTVDFKCSLQELPVVRVAKVSKKDRYYFAVGLNKPDTTVKVEELSGVDKSKIIQEWSVNHDTLMVFTNDTLQEAIKLRIFDGKTLSDTVDVKMISGTSKKKEQEKLNLFVYQTPESSDTTMSMMLKSEHPIKSSKGFAYIYRDTILVDSVIPSMQKVEYPREFSVSYKWKRGDQYRVMIPSGVFTDIYGLTNDTINKSFAMTTDRLSGVLIVKVRGLFPDKKYLLQLTSEKLDVIKQKEIKVDGDYKFEYINPSSYKIRLVDDVDQNKEWTPGNIRKKQQPERIAVTDNLQVRANWELETEITIQ